MDELEAERVERVNAGKAEVRRDRPVDQPVHDPVDGPAPEVEVSTDIIKRGLLVAPVLIAVCGVIWGGDGAWSAMYGIALVLANFALAAGLIAVTIRISLTVMLGAVLFGYLLRLGLIFVAVFVVKDAGGFRSRPSERPSSSLISGSWSGSSST